MQARLVLSILATGAVAMGAHSAAAQNRSAALTGQVTSDAEGKMEGVVVSARKVGSPVTVSVMSDAQGRYSFPADRLSSGKYSIAIRAIGYDLAPTTADVADEHTATVDLKLAKTKHLAAQMSNAEWIASIPGTEDQKAGLLDCVSCHTLERIVRSTHDSNEFTQVITRMRGYGAVSQPIKPQRMLDPARSGTPEQYRKFADYLATINLSEVDHWQYPLKTLARPTGRATRAIITEYELPRATTEPHDVLVDAQGAVWYSDFGESYISKYDPKTLKLTEYPVTQFKSDAPVGNLSLEFDTKGTLWFDTMYQGSLGNLDPKTEKITWYPLAPEYNDYRVQLNFVGLRHDVDGKVWTKSVGTQDIYRLELASGKWERFQPLKDLASKPASIYQVISDSKNNLWMAEFQRGHIGKIDAKTTKVTWYPLPTDECAGAAHGDRRPGSPADHRISRQQARAVRYQAARRSRNIRCRPTPSPTARPPTRTASCGPAACTPTARCGSIRRPARRSNTSCRMRPTCARVFVDNSTSPVTFWTGSNHKATLVKVEPLD